MTVARDNTGIFEKGIALIMIWEEYQQENFQCNENYNVVFNYELS